eukprot:2782653-Amphidinium_carterae.1
MVWPSQAAVANHGSEPQAWQVGRRNWFGTVAGWTSRGLTHQRGPSATTRKDVWACCAGFEVVETASRFSFHWEPRREHLVRACVTKQDMFPRATRFRSRQRRDDGR